MRRSFSVTWLAVAAIIGAMVGIGLWTAMAPTTSTVNTSSTGAAIRFADVFPENLRVFYWFMSPDGQTVCYLVRPKVAPEGEEVVNHLYLRSLNDLELRRVEGSDGATGMLFSADSKWLFMPTPVAPRSTKFQVWKVPVDGSAPPLVLLDYRDNWVAPWVWLSNGDILIQERGRKSFVRFPSSGGEVGESVAITTVDYDGSFRPNPRFGSALPDGVHILGTATTYSERGFETNVAWLNTETGESQILIENGSSPTVTSTGHLVFARGDALLATDFDPSSLRTSGNTVAVQAGFRALAGYGDTDFHLGADGTLLHWPGGIYGDKRQLVFVEHDGGRTLRLGDAWSDDLRFFEGGSAVNREGSMLAVSITNDGGLYETWISDMDRPRLSRFAYKPGQDCTPMIWTPKGESLVYSCETTDEEVLYVRSVDTNGEPRELLRWQSGEDYFATSITPDGSSLVVTHSREGEERPRADPARAGKRWLGPGQAVARGCQRRRGVRQRTLAGLSLRRLRTQRDLPAPPARRRLPGKGDPGDRERSQLTLLERRRVAAPDHVPPWRRDVRDRHRARRNRVAGAIDRTGNPAVPGDEFPHPPVGWALARREEGAGRGPAGPGQRGAELDHRVAATARRVSMNSTMFPKTRRARMTSVL